ncbi:MAG: glycerol-3-phosphate dehydrogenase/oxidase, partial [Sciscionella sp.]
IVVPRDRIVGESGLILRTEKSVLFVIPWRNHWIVGTTDSEFNLDLAHPAATSTDIDYILTQVNSVLATPLSSEDIEGVYAGLRPLLSGESEETSKLSREHAVARVAPGMVAIAGGKYTTYRVMAADAVDAAGADLSGRLQSSITDKVPLLGADGYHALINQADQLASRYGVHPYRVRHLLDRYGSLISEVLAPAAADPELLKPLSAAPDYLCAEIVYGAAQEGAMHLEDMLARRTRISIEYAHRGVDCALQAAELMAGVLGWDKAEIQREVDIYRARVEAERESQTQSADQEAAGKRAVAPEPRPKISDPVG